MDELLRYLQHWTTKSNRDHDFNLRRIAKIFHLKKKKNSIYRIYTHDNKIIKEEFWTIEISIIFLKQNYYFSYTLDLST